MKRFGWALAVVVLSSIGSIPAAWAEATGTLTVEDTVIPAHGTTQGTVSVEWINTSPSLASIVVRPVPGPNDDPTEDNPDRGLIIGEQGVMSGCFFIQETDEGSLKCEFTPVPGDTASVDFWLVAATDEGGTWQLIVEAIETVPDSDEHLVTVVASQEITVQAAQAATTTTAQSATTTVSTATTTTLSTLPYTGTSGTAPLLVLALVLLCAGAGTVATLRHHIRS